MAVDIQWTDNDPDTGEKRFVCVERFARKWQFMARFKRRENWDKNVRVTKEMWETLYDAMQRRYQRREGIEETELVLVKKIITDWKETPLKIVSDFKKDVEQEEAK